MSIRAEEQTWCREGGDHGREVIEGEPGGDGGVGGTGPHEQSYILKGPL